jgi:hypothetical protein
MLFAMADTEDGLKKAGRFLSKLGSQIGKAAKVAGNQIADAAKVAGPKVVETAKVVGPQIASGAKAAGSAVAHTAKQVTGLGRGSVRLELDQTRSAPGGTITGRVLLALSEPIEAKRLVVQLRARQKMVTVNRDGGGKGVGTSHADVFEFELELGGAKTYQSETLPFELTIPADALELKASAPSTPLGDIARTIASTVSPTAGPIEWQVVTRLQIAWGRDLTHDVDIVVTR